MKTNNKFLFSIDLDKIKKALNSCQNNEIKDNLLSIIRELIDGKNYSISFCVKNLDKSKTKTIQSNFNNIKQQINNKNHKDKNYNICNYQDDDCNIKCFYNHENDTIVFLYSNEIAIITKNSIILTNKNMIIKNSKEQSTPEKIYEQLGQKYALNNIKKTLFYEINFLGNEIKRNIFFYDDDDNKKILDLKPFIDQHFIIDYKTDGIIFFDKHNNKKKIILTFETDEQKNSNQTKLVFTPCFYIKYYVNADNDNNLKNEILSLLPTMNDKIRFLSKPLNLEEKKIKLRFFTDNSYDRDSKAITTTQEYQCFDNCNCRINLKQIYEKAIKGLKNLFHCD